MIYFQSLKGPLPKFSTAVWHSDVPGAQPDQRHCQDPREEMETDVLILSKNVKLFQRPLLRGAHEGGQGRTAAPAA